MTSPDREGPEATGATYIALGEPWGGKKERHTEGPRYNFRHGRHTLDIFLDEPTGEEVRSFNQGPMQMGRWLVPPALWVIFHIEGMEWSDAPYSPHLVEPEGRTMRENSTESSRKPLMIMTLNDARDGATLAIRDITMSDEMGQQIEEAAKSLLQEPWDERAYNRRIAQVYREYLDTREMKHLARRIETLGV